jgi:hypothetical protein
MPERELVVRNIGNWRLICGYDRSSGEAQIGLVTEQIAAWLKRTHPEDECNQVSHETI